MLVQAEVAFEKPTDDDLNSLRAIALEHTSDVTSVRVVAKTADPCWLVATFTMPDQAQIRAVDKLDRSFRFSLWNREDSIIRFPKRGKPKSEKR